MLCIALVAFQNKLTDACLAFQGDFIGCTEQEILSIEDQFRVQLPMCYRDFLSVMGRYAGYFLVGSDYSFPTMLGFRDAADELLRRCQVEFELSPSAFVFLSHQGYNYCWFNCRNHADDPPVYLFTDSEKGPRLVSGSFSAWLLAAVEDDIAAYRELYGD